jgi:hypothetical protein
LPNPENVLTLCKREDRTLHLSAKVKLGNNTSTLYSKFQTKVEAKAWFNYFDLAFLGT